VQHERGPRKPKSKFHPLQPSSASSWVQSRRQLTPVRGSGERDVACPPLLPPLLVGPPPPTSAFDGGLPLLPSLPANLSSSPNTALLLGAASCLPALIYPHLGSLFRHFSGVGASAMKTATPQFTSKSTDFGDVSSLASSAISSSSQGATETTSEAGARMLFSLVAWMKSMKSFCALSPHDQVSNVVKILTLVRQTRSHS
jgi:hypothetical protein